MSGNGFKRICPGCEYLRLNYNAVADKYCCESVGEYCAKSEYGVERCPRSAQWREHFRRKEQEELEQLERMLR